MSAKHDVKASEYLCKDDVLASENVHVGKDDEKACGNLYKDDESHTVYSADGTTTEASLYQQGLKITQMVGECFRK